jgi:hypothetical protein
MEKTGILIRFCIDTNGKIGIIKTTYTNHGKGIFILIRNPDNNKPTNFCELDVMKTALIFDVKRFL